MAATDLGRAALFTEKLLDNLSLELYAETSLVSHGFSQKVQPEGKVLSPS